MTLEAPDMTIPVPERLRSIVGPTTGRTLIAGFRPDHLELTDGGATAARIRGRADVVEYLGAQELIHVSAAGKDLIAIVNASHAVRSGDNLTLSLSLDKLHLFDAETGVSLNAMAYATPTAPASVSA